MITNSEGDVALKYYKQQQVLTRGTPSRKDRVFVVNANISLAFVDPVDVDHLLARMIRNRTCCPGGRANGPAYSYATQAEVDKWLGVE